MKLVDKYFPEEAKLKEAAKCPFCAKLVNTNLFRDKVSLREFNISGLCQKCQDEFFGG